jgi:hypothetical protein
MKNIFELLAEVEEAIDHIKHLKNKALEHYHEDKKTAKDLLINLNLLEKDANELLLFFKNDIN